MPFALITGNGRRRLKERKQNGEKGDEIELGEPIVRGIAPTSFEGVGS